MAMASKVISTIFMVLVGALGTFGDEKIVRTRTGTRAFGRVLFSPEVIGCFLDFIRCSAEAYERSKTTPDTFYSL